MERGSSGGVGDSVLTIIKQHRRQTLRYTSSHPPCITEKINFGRSVGYAQWIEVTDLNE